MPPLPALPRYLLTGKGIEKTWNINIMEFNVNARGSEILGFAGKGIELEIIVLSEISCIKRDKWHILFLMSRI